MEAAAAAAAKQWVISINKELENLPNIPEESARWSKRSIYRIPASVTDINRRAYKPQIVSFGPYHHGNENMKAMEEHKRRALLHFLKRSKKSLQSYVDALAPAAQDLKDAYDQLGPDWEDTEKFLELMIVDGCFVLEILRAATSATNRAEQAQAHHQPPAPLPAAQCEAADEPTQPQPRNDQSLVRDYAANDPIFSKHGKLYIVPYLKRDMLMLENQIPMLVLEKLVAVQNDKSLKVISLSLSLA